MPPRDPSPAPFDGSFRQQVPLGEYPTEMMLMACTKCSRTGKLSKAKLIEEWGPQMGLVDLLQVIAKGCPKQTPDYQGIRRCGVHYTDLT